MEHKPSASPTEHFQEKWIRSVGWVELLRNPSTTPKPIILRPLRLMGFGKSREERALPLPILRSAILEAHYQRSNPEQSAVARLDLIAELFHRSRVFLHELYFGERLAAIGLFDV